MKSLSQTAQFAKDVKRMRKRGKDLGKLKIIVRRLAEGQPLDLRHRDHPLQGNWKHCRDCHVEPDWILIYFADEVELRLERTGTHADLFRS